MISKISHSQYKYEPCWSHLVCCGMHTQTKPEMVMKEKGLLAMLLARHKLSHYDYSMFLLHPDIMATSVHVQLTGVTILSGYR